MAEDVEPRLRIGREGRQRGEDDARRAEHHGHRPRPVDSDAEGRRLLVARAGDLRRLEDLGQPLGGQLERRQNVLAPAPPGHVEQQGPGRVGDVDRALAQQPQAHVVLR